jgi:microsomal epoxide hydrolase
MLTDPKRFGGDASDAFTVLAPSLPGYTLSFTPGQPRFGCVEIAEVFAILMTDVLVTLLVRREDPTPDEKIFIAELDHYLKEDTGYQWIKAQNQRHSLALRSRPSGSRPGSWRTFKAGRTIAAQ